MTTAGGDEEASSAGTLGVPEENDSDGDFAFFRLIGERFNAPGMPADTAREVGYFRDAVVKAARELWIADNPGRTNAPAGFDAAFDLRLLDVERTGSARARMVLNRPSSVTDDEEWSEWSSFFKRGRDLVATALRQVETTGLPPTVEASTTRAMKRLGTSLGESEALTVGSPVDPAKHGTTDTRVREILKRIDDVVQPAAVESGSVEGVISEYDGLGLSFRLRTADGQDVRCGLERFNQRLVQFARDVLALDGVTAPDVRVEGASARYNSRGTLVGLTEVYDISLVRTVEEKRLLARIDAVRALEDGWLGDGTLAPSPALCDRIELVVRELGLATQSVSIVPTGDGELVIEWNRGGSEYSAIVGESGDMQLFEDDPSQSRIVSRTLPFSVDDLRNVVNGGQSL